MQFSTDSFDIRVKNNKTIYNGLWLFDRHFTLKWSSTTGCLFVEINVFLLISYLIRMIKSLRHNHQQSDGILLIFTEPNLQHWKSYSRV